MDQTYSQISQTTFTVQPNTTFHQNVFSNFRN